MGEKVVVTGANGFVGSHLVEALIAKGYEVHCVLRKSSNMQWLRNLPITLHTCGVENVEALKPILADAIYIYHIAGVVKARSWEGYHHGNVVLTKNILEATVGNKVIKGLVITSSLACSAATIQGSPVDEKTPSNPLTYYGKSKLEQEQLSLSYADRLPITVVRPCVVYGERDTEVFLFFKAMNSRILPSIGFDEKTLSMVYIHDLISGMILAAESPNSKGKQYFLGGSEDEYSWKQIGEITGKYLNKNYLRIRVPHSLVFIVGHLAEFFAKVTGNIATINSQKANEMVQKSWSCSSNRAKADFNYTPKYSLDEGIKRSIEWYRKEKWL